jgi:hypothetical protein
MVTATTSSSMKIVAGTKRITAIGAMNMSRFMELIFSLRGRQTLQGFNYQLQKIRKFKKKEACVIPLRRHKNPLQDCLECPCSSRSNAHDESEEMKARLSL